MSGRLLGPTSASLGMSERRPVIAANWSLPMKLFERGLDRGSQAFDMPIAFIEITPTAPGTHPPS